MIVARCIHSASETQLILGQCGRCVPPATGAQSSEKLEFREPCISHLKRCGAGEVTPRRSTLALSGRRLACRKSINRESGKDMEANPAS
jgi:hypothetical protein